jgi:TolA-binding protein
MPKLGWNLGEVLGNVNSQSTGSDYGPRLDGGLGAAVPLRDLRVVAQDIQKMQQRVQGLQRQLVELDREYLTGQNAIRGEIEETKVRLNTYRDEAQQSIELVFGEMCPNVKIDWGPDETTEPDILDIRCEEVK